ncbi:MAG: transposase [Verrucomicrobiota bacterium]
MLQPGNGVEKDDLLPHKSPQTLRFITEASAEVRFLPTYSPDLNSIGTMWSKKERPPIRRSPDAGDSTGDGSLPLLARQTGVEFRTA